MLEKEKDDLGWKKTVLGIKSGLWEVYSRRR